MTMDKRRSSDIEAELDTTRDQLGETLDALRHRLSTEDLLERGRGYLRASGGNEFVVNLGRSVRRNPVPLSLLGVGLSWLMLAGSDRLGRAIDRNKPDFNTGGGDSSGSGDGSGIRDAADKTRRQTKSAAQDLYRNVGQTASSGQASLSQASDRARRGASNIAGGARRSASRAGSAARRGGMRLGDGANYMRREQPLVSSAIGLALGAVIAATLPRSTFEDDAMGSARDDVVASAQETGQEKAGQAQSVAESAVAAARDAAGSEAERQGLRDGDNPDEDAAETGRP